MENNKHSDEKRIYTKKTKGQKAYMSYKKVKQEMDDLREDVTNDITEMYEDFSGLRNATLPEEPSPTQKLIDIMVYIGSSYACARLMIDAHFIIISYFTKRLF